MSVVSAGTARRGVCSVQSDQQPGLAEPALALLTLNARGLIRLTSDCDRITKRCSCQLIKRRPISSLYVLALPYVLVHVGASSIYLVVHVYAVAKALVIPSAQSYIHSLITHKPRCFAALLDNYLLVISQHALQSVLFCCQNSLKIYRLETADNLSAPSLFTANPVKSQPIFSYANVTYNIIAAKHITRMLRDCVMHGLQQRNDQKYLGRGVDGVASACIWN